MTLEQRIEALEKKVASLTLPNAKSEELEKIMQDAVQNVIKNACRPGGMRSNESKKAANNKAAKQKNYSSKMSLTIIA